MKPFLRRSLPFLIGGMALTLALYFTLFQSRNFFAGLSDGCFVSGAVLVLISLVCVVSASGLFDRAGYSFYSFRRIFKRDDAKPATFEEYMYQAEKALMDTYAVIPIYYYTNPYLAKTNVKDFLYSPLGFVYFRTAYIEG